MTRMRLLLRLCEDGSSAPSAGLTMSGSASVEARFDSELMLIGGIVKEVLSFARLCLMLCA